jgi:mediator of RNA polymerase II transcription subunit 12
MLADLVKSNPESFIYPSAWLKHRQVLKAIIPVEDEAAHQAFNNIDARNSRLLLSSSGYTPAGRQQLVKLLDSTFLTQNDDLAAKCWATNSDKAAIVKTVVEWATSIHRPGLAKIYVAVALLKSWLGTPGFDATMPILETLDKVPAADQTRKLLVYRLFSELVRVNVVSVPQYLRWLIARGGCHGPGDIDAEEAPCATRLLVEMPIHCFQEKWLIERANLLRRSGSYSVASEELDISNALKCVDHSLGQPLPADDPIAQRKPMSLRKLSNRLSDSNIALRTSVASHLSRLVARQVPTEANAALNVQLFTSVRTLLESMGDFSMLSAVIKTCTVVTNPELLGACGDAINANLPIFLAMGSGAELFNILLERLKGVSQQQGLISRPLLAAMSHLAKRMPARGELAKQLRQELLLNDRSNAIDACSPVSDNMLPQTQANEGEFSEEIDKLLASGNRIDHPTMNRLFRTIIPKLEAGWAKMDDCRRVFASSLTKMRVFDPQHFDKLMADWVSHVRYLQTRPLLVDLFPLLISVGCLNVSTLVHTANSSPPTSSDSGQGSAVYFQELLQLLLIKLPKSAPLTPDESYHFSIHQQAAASEDPNAFLSLIRHAVMEYGNARANASPLTLPLDNLVMQNHIMESLRHLVVVDSVAVSEAFSMKTMPAEAAELVCRLISKMLVPGGDEPIQASFDQILGLANELTLPFCQLKLNFDLLMSESSLSSSEDQTTSRFELFANAMDRALDAGNIMWTSMLPCLSSDIAQHLKNLAQGRLLSIIPSLKNPQRADATSTDLIRMAENLLGVIEAISAGQPPQQSAMVTGTLIQKLSDMLEIVASKEEDTLPLRAVVLANWLPVMMRLLLLHTAVSESTATPSSSNPTSNRPPALVHHEPRARLLYLLCGLLVEFQSLPQQEAGKLSQKIFDLAILIADTLPEDLRNQCAKHILLTPGSMASTNLSSDQRLFYILSTPQLGAADNLVLSHKEKNAVPQSSGRAVVAMYGLGPAQPERLTPFVLRRWEMLSESTPNVGENDTSLSLGLFESIKIH